MTDTPIQITHEDRHDSLRLIPWWDQSKLADSKILVVGAGALGNEAIKNLALLGVGHIGIVDMDHVEHSNLSRSVLYRSRDAGRPKVEVAAERAQEIDPNIRVTPIAANVIHEVGLGWFDDADLVLGCLDNREARLWVNRCCWHVGTPWIDAGIQEISGVVQVFVPPDGTCYECGMKEADYRLINLRYSCPLLQAEDIRRGRVPTTPTIASIIAGWQIQEALKLLHDLPAAKSCAMVFHGMTNNVYRTQLPRRDDCLSHDPWGDLHVLENVDAGSTLAELQQAIVEISGLHPVSMRLTRDFVTDLSCEPCGTTVRHQTLRGLTPASAASCPDCSQTMTPEIITQIDFEQSTFSDRTLTSLGIPAADVVLIEFEDGLAAFRLKGDTFRAANEEAASTNNRPSPGDCTEDESQTTRPEGDATT